MPRGTVSSGRIGSSFSLSSYLAIMMADGCLGMITASGASLGVARVTSTIMQSTTIAEHVDGQSSVTTFKGRNITSQSREKIQHLQRVTVCD